MSKNGIGMPYISSYDAFKHTNYSLKNPFQNYFALTNFFYTDPNCNNLYLLTWRSIHKSKKPSELLNLVSLEPNFLVLYGTLYKKNSKSIFIKIVVVDIIAHYGDCFNYRKSFWVSDGKNWFFLEEPHEIYREHYKLSQDFYFKPRDEFPFHMCKDYEETNQISLKNIKLFNYETKEKVSIHNEFKSNNDNKNEYDNPNEYILLATFEFFNNITLMTEMHSIRAGVKFHHYNFSGSINIPLLLKGVWLSTIDNTFLFHIPIDSHISRDFNDFLISQKLRNSEFSRSNQYYLIRDCIMYNKEKRICPWTSLQNSSDKNLFYIYFNLHYNDKRKKILSSSFINDYVLLIGKGKKKFRLNFFLKSIDNHFFKVYNSDKFFIPDLFSYTFFDNYYLNRHLIFKSNNTLLKRNCKVLIINNYSIVDSFSSLSFFHSPSSSSSSSSSTSPYHSFFELFSPDSKAQIQGIIVPNNSETKFNINVILYPVKYHITIKDSTKGTFDKIYLYDEWDCVYELDTPAPDYKANQSDFYDKLSDLFILFNQLAHPSKELERLYDPIIKDPRSFDDSYEYSISCPITRLLTVDNLHIFSKFCYENKDFLFDNLGIALAKIRFSQEFFNSLLYLPPTYEEFEEQIEKERRYIAMNKSQPLKKQKVSDNRDYNNMNNYNFNPQYSNNNYIPQNNPTFSNIREDNYYNNYSNTNKDNFSNKYYNQYNNSNYYFQDRNSNSNNNSFNNNPNSSNYNYKPDNFGNENPNQGEEDNIDQNGPIVIVDPDLVPLSKLWSSTDMPKKSILKKNYYKKPDPKNVNFDLNSNSSHQYNLHH